MDGEHGIDQFGHVSKSTGQSTDPSDNAEYTFVSKLGGTGAAEERVGRVE